MANLDPAQNRKLLKSAVATHYGTIRAAEEIVTEETKKATGAIKALVESEGPGPHMFSEKDGKGGTRKFFLTFRKSKGADSYSITRKEHSAEDDATPIATPPEPAAAPAG